MNKNQKGFTLIEGLLIIIAITLVGFAGWYVWNANQDKKEKNDSNTSTQEQASVAPEPDPTADWKSYTDPEGQFSLKYPATWATATHPDLCDSRTFLLGATSASVGTCASENIGQMAFSSAPVEAGIPEGFDPAYYENIKTADVTINGVQGKKYTGKFKGTEAFPESYVQTLYQFKTAGMVYSADYYQQSGYPDVLSDFDLIVTKTLKFN